MSKLKTAKRALELLDILNYKKNVGKLTVKKIGLYTTELTDCLEILGLDSEDLDESAVQLKLIVELDESLISGKRRELLERHIKYGEYGTADILKDLLEEEVTRSKEDFYNNLEQKIEHYTKKEENASSDFYAEKFADICGVYVSMLHILDVENQTEITRN